MPKNPASFTKFITELSIILTDIIRKNFGIFDKFTGDGVLCFFPDFYTGADALYYALKTAKECHTAFEIFYGKNRECFKCIIQETGLGIGIDCGEAHLSKIGFGYSAVGEPVVYACRLSSAPAGKTYLNQTAFEELKRLYYPHYEVHDAEINAKPNGPITVYEVVLNCKAFSPQLPPWLPSQEKPEYISTGNSPEISPEKKEADPTEVNKAD